MEQADTLFMGNTHAIQEARERREMTDQEQVKP